MGRNELVWNKYVFLILKQLTNKIKRNLFEIYKLN
jgi:hypothetical protein